MATAIEVAKEYFPNADNDFIDYAIWEETGYPAFWNIPADGATPEACFRKQLADLKQRIDSA